MQKEKRKKKKKKLLHQSIAQHTTVRSTSIDTIDLDSHSPSLYKSRPEVFDEVVDAAKMLAVLTNKWCGGD